jgi:hypothetical protein
MPVILATLEAEFRRILVPCQPGQKKFARLHINGKKLGVVMNTCHPSNGGKHKIRLWSRSAWGKSENLPPK